MPNPTGINGPRDTKLKNDKLRRLRALKMIEMRIHNQSIPTIAKEFNVHPMTVTRTLEWAEKANLLVEAEDKMLQELVPLAHQALSKALTDGDAAVALEVMKGIGLLKKPMQRVPTAQQIQDESQLEVYIEAKRKAFELKQDERKELGPVQIEVMDVIEAHDGNTD